MVAESSLYSRSLEFVAQGCRGPMSIHVADLLGLDARIAHGIAHNAEPAFAIFGRLSHVVCVGAHAIANNLGQDCRTPSLRVFQFLQNQYAGSFAYHETVTVFVPGTTGPVRI